MSCRPRASNTFAQFDVETTDTTPPRLPTQSVFSRISTLFLIVCCTSTICLAVFVCASTVLRMSVVEIEAHESHESHESHEARSKTSVLHATPVVRQRTRRRIRRGILQRLALLERHRPSERAESRRGIDVQSAAELFPHWFDDASVDPPVWNVDNVLREFALALAYLSQSDEPMQPKPWTNDVATLATIDDPPVPPNIPPLQVTQ